MNKTHKTVIIFDWDDTLYPTTYVHHVGMTSNQILLLDSIIYKLFTTCLNYGQIYIITNASMDWIVHTISALPQTSNIINYLKIISARDDNIKAINNISYWKSMSFKKEYTTLLAIHKNLNIISIGDAYYEHNALVNLHDYKNNNILKTIKCKSNPSFEILCEELIILTKMLNTAIINKTHIDWIFK